ncbi:hypothetical protein IWX65_003408 [Arthrobacter sp. CAN_A214]|uniref:hypothetical protein n=1 Tax=Arthrobacter sp. CAN_A214 TaxID=2787720 RepID=UPI0018CAD999
MDASSPPPDAGRELDELRRRAYGRHPDIQDDPAALARLTELEAARTASPRKGATEISEAAPAAEGAPAADFAWTMFGADRPDSAAGSTAAVSSEGSPRSLRHRITASRTRRGWFLAGALVGFLALAYTVEALVGPRPDATLYPIAGEADSVVFSLLEFLGADVDRTSIRGYEAYRGVEPWFAVDKQGLQCFMLIDRSGPTVDGANCVPPGVDLFADIDAWFLSGAFEEEGLPQGASPGFITAATRWMSFSIPHRKPTKTWIPGNRWRTRAPAAATSACASAGISAISLSGAGLA